MPLVSILIPNYNYEVTIDECIKSALAQTYPNCEIIVLDNKSTDNSYFRAKKFKKYGVKVLKNKFNMGVISHNKLITLAKGKYVHILHSDDIIYPTFIEECVNLMEKYPNVGFTVTEREEIDQYGNIIDSAPFFYNTSCIIPGASQKGVLMMASYYVPSQTVYRREILEMVGMYNITYFMDWWMLYTCSSISDMGCINKILCKYRIWPLTDSGYMTRNLLMPICGFSIRHTFFDIARFDNDKCILDRYDAAIYKQADLTLKLATQVIKEGLFETGKRYLYLALSQCEEISESELYKVINEYLNLPNKTEEDINEILKKKGLAGRRILSYDPPKGFKVYNA